jgi:LacI family transcriptional regulator, galactose operon repressor
MTEQHPDGGRPPTLADVAREAGVSVTTTSLVLRLPDPPNIGPGTQERVRAAAKRLGYVRNQAATDLRSQANSAIGFIADGIAMGPFAGDMIRGAQDAAWQRGYLLLIVETGHDPRLVREAVTRFAERRVRRIIYAPVGHQQVDLPQELADTDPVLANSFDAGHRFSSFVPDEAGGARLAVQTLLATRSAPVGFINLEEGDTAAAGRLAGYRAALDEAGLPFDGSYVIHTGRRRTKGGPAELRIGALRFGAMAADGYQAARVLFRRHPDLSLLFCGTDRMAMGAYDYLKETGRKIPHDVAVVGFDNQLLIATQVRPHHDRPAPLRDGQARRATGARPRQGRRPPAGSPAVPPGHPQIHSDLAAAQAGRQPSAPGHANPVLKNCSGTASRTNPAPAAAARPDVIPASRRAAYLVQVASGS